MTITCSYSYTDQSIYPSISSYTVCRVDVNQVCLQDGQGGLKMTVDRCKVQTVSAMLYVCKENM